MALPSRADAMERLLLIFPRDAFDPTMSSPLAASAVVAFLYARAVVTDDQSVPLTVSDILLRPSATLWMSDEALARQQGVDRAAWLLAVSQHSAKKALAKLHEMWDAPFEPWYADNTRETLRDETFSHWAQVGAIRARTDLPTTSGMPRWGLTESFAALFDPALSPVEALVAIATWRDTHLDTGARLRVQVAHDRATSTTATPVTLPDGSQRSLAPGDASAIIKGVVEQWATVRLDDPVVLAISEPGDKLHVGDARLLGLLGISLNVSEALPDALIADLGTEPVTVWFVEAVATDGPVSARRKIELTDWAEANGLTADQLAFLTAFTSRRSAPARKRLTDLAEGTFAWFLDEPAHELAWYELG